MEYTHEHTKKIHTNTGKMARTCMRFLLFVYFFFYRLTWVFRCILYMCVQIYIEDSNIIQSNREHGEKSNDIVAWCLCHSHNIMKTINHLNRCILGQQKRIYSCIFCTYTYIFTACAVGCRVAHFGLSFHFVFKFYRESTNFIHSKTRHL